MKINFSLRRGVLRGLQDMVKMRLNNNLTNKEDNVGTLQALLMVLVPSIFVLAMGTLAFTNLSARGRATEIENPDSIRFAKVMKIDYAIFDDRYWAVTNKGDTAMLVECSLNNLRYDVEIGGKRFYLNQ